MSAKPTPGPWHVGADGVTIVQPHPQAVSERAKQQGYIVARSCYATVDGMPSEQTKANARLIASAPALVDWIRSVLDRHMLDDHDRQLWEEFHNGGRQLLATIDGDRS